MPAALTTWRQTLHPPDDRWWWFLDQVAQKREEEQDLLWILLTGALVTLMIPLATEIIRRLWAGAPDGASVFGSLLTLLLTGSPATKRGRELAQWLLKRVPRLGRRFHAEATTAMASLAFVLMLAVRLLLPQVAVLYNNRGHAAVGAGDLTTAQHSFQRAVALNPDLAVGYYHLGTVYEDIGRPDDAIIWYQRALERDLDLGPAYNNLGRLYVREGELDHAVQVLLAGLGHARGDEEVEQVTRYRLLSNLGWAYYQLEQPALARKVLESALALEDELDVAFKSAMPHYLLALTYEVLEQPDAASQQWKESLRYIDDEDPDQIGWADTAHAHLRELEEDIP